MEDPSQAFDGALLKTTAARYGTHVDYQSHTVNAFEGHTYFEARYRFRDVSDLSVRLDPGLPLVEGLKKDHAPSTAYPAYRFHHRGQGRFTIYAPKDTGRSGTPLHVRVESETAKKQQQERLEQERAQWMKFGNPFELSGTETREELIRTLAKGMRFRLEVEALDPITSTTSPYRLGKNRILLYSIELDQLLKEPEMRPLFFGSGAKGPTWSDLSRSKSAVLETSRYRLLELGTGENTPEKREK